MTGRDAIRGHVALTNHLQHNVYPPMPEWLGVAKAAIEAADEGDPERWIDSEGLVRMPSGQPAHIPAWQVIENLHLEDFVTVEVDA